MVLPDIIVSSRQDTHCANRKENDVSNESELEAERLW